MAGSVFDDFDFGRVRCPSCGAEFNEADIKYMLGDPVCPDCEEVL